MIRILVKGLVWFLVKLVYRHKVYGKKHLIPGGALIVSNHCSFLDPPLVAVSCSDKIHFLGRGSLFRSRSFAWLLRQLCTHPVDRGKGNAQTFKLAIDLVQNGNKVGIFPEGRRSSTGQLNPGERGVGMLVQRARCQIIPVYTHGTFEIWSVKHPFPKLRGKTACVFGSPITWDFQRTTKKEGQEEIVAEIMQRIAALKHWYLAGAKGSPP